MNMEEKETREYVEAVPGPAFVISKETYKRMQENNNAEKTRERLNKSRELFSRIIDKNEQEDESGM